jgi:hypothetical protein
VLKLASIGLALTLAGTVCAQAGLSYSFSVDPASILIGGTADVELSLTFTADAGETFDYFEGSGTIDAGDGRETSVSWDTQTVSFSESFAYASGGVFSPSFSGKYQFSEDDGFIAYQGVGPLQLQTTLTVGSVPEANTWAMLALGFAAMGIMARSGWRTRAQAAAL